MIKITLELDYDNFNQFWKSWLGRTIDCVIKSENCISWGVGVDLK